jgi:hypothetical protein
MSKPFQFSMAQLFWAMACFCVAACSLSVVARYGLGPMSKFRIGPGVATLGLIAVGAGLGVLISSTVRFYRRI